MKYLLENFWFYPFLSFLFSFLVASPIIKLLNRLKSIQSFREQGPSSHIETKAGTPTMGAWIFLLAIFIFTSWILIQTPNLKLFLVLLAFLIGAILGGIDDLLKILKSNYKGLGSKSKLIVQFLASSSIAYFSGRLLVNEVEFDGVGVYTVLLNALWAFLVMAGTSNAVNLSDGLDGLATGLSIIAFASFLTLLQDVENLIFQEFIFIIIAALFAFFLFNKKPAKVFMGDTGSLALGLGLGAFAYVLHLEWYLIVFAFVPLLETLSVVLQVMSAKFSRKFLGKDIRIFKMAPLHHHLELVGISENKIVFSFLFIQLMLSVSIKFF
jgi:phospho-N-acetylmuramoyl-pentapeptide-transferase